MSRVIRIDSFLEYFFKEPVKWFHVREMARLSKVNATTASKYLNELNREGFILRKLERGHLLFKADTESATYKDAKVCRNIRQIKGSGLIEYLDKELHFPTAIVLFGSFSRGENDKNSDVDIFALSNIKKQVSLDKFNKLLGAEIQLFLKSNEEFRDMQKKNKNLANSILNGSIIKGFLEVF
ncbi:nucleotidyltransferase domain-containing protein [Candidatus Woesearchaeota archaeon]|nr:nucleotidyltransferase domain-containing protein [Candidatus Woesearchaeota archaeon]